MKNNLYTFLKGLENLEIKNLSDLEKFDIKLNIFKEKIKDKKESISNRLKLVIIEKIIEANKQENFVFIIANKNKRKRDE